MADQKQDSNESSQPIGGDSSSSKTTTNTFHKGMMKDYNELFVGEGLYTHARNAVNNSHDGQVGVIGNEPSNIKCVDLPYTLIGATHLGGDEWVLFMTDDTHSEIGRFKESICKYEKIVNDDCLNFKRSHLITAANRERYDCGTIIYFDDGLNPTRTMNIDDVPWKTTNSYVNGCLVRTYPTYPNGDKILDCEAIRIAPLLTHPCITISKGKLPGTLPNGSYQVCIAYTVNQVRFTDYIGLTAVQGLFEHQNTACSLQVEISNIDKDFDEFELVVLSNINAQTVAKRIGYYSTSQGTIYIDRWDPEYETIPVSEIVFRSEPIEKSDAMYTVGPYLLRTGVYTKFKFNYQPLANQIKAKWVVVEYPQQYYLKGNHNTGYMRDEQYAFFIRFVYNTGEFSESYHIPGRPSTLADTANVPCFEGLLPKWQIENTAAITSTTTVARQDGGTEIARGDMAYWQSIELYPADKPDIWNSFPNIPGNSLNLCGKPIRHHKMPDETVGPQLALFNNNSTNIRVLGVEFENISWPLDENGQPITSIVGYQILRGSREGNKTILAKGLINNMREYDIPGNPTKGLFQNYPYNDLRADEYLTSKFQDADNYTSIAQMFTPGSGNFGSDIIAAITNTSQPPLTAYKQNIFSFHSPEVSFSSPFLSVYDLKIYSEYYGNSYGQFKIPYKHPKFKFISNFLNVIIDLAASVVALTDLIKTVLGRHAPDFDWHLVNDNEVNVQQNIFQSHKNDIDYGHQKPLEIEGDALNGGGGSWSVAGIGSTGGGSTSPIGGGAIRTTQTAEGWWNTDGDDNEVTSRASVKLRNTANNAITIANAAIAGLLAVHRQITLQEQFYKLVLGLIPYRQYACQYNSYGFYDKASPNTIAGNQRRQIQNAYYVGPGIQSFPVFDPISQTTSQYQINNLFRSRTVVFNVTNGNISPNIADPTRQDRSRVIKSKASNGNSIALDTVFGTPISSWYGAMRIAVPSQYGQLETIKQLPVSTCIYILDITKTNATSIKYRTTNTVFGGDTYINRFTEKNTMFFFDNWLMGELEGAGSDIDYTKYSNIPWPRYWANTTNLNGQIWKFASKYRQLDDLIPGIWYVAQGYFYLFNSGIRDFFVESEVNVAYRDWEEDVPKRHYDPFRFTDYNNMFRSDIIKSGNYYKYDYSLSISKLFNSSITWGNTLPRDYDPVIAADCYKYSPSLVIYSLPQTDEGKKDNWRAFLTNNRKEFYSKVTSIKSINKTGSLFMMIDQSPLSFMGVEELKLDGTSAKITIGDGKLFETGQNQLQSITNADSSFEYGSNQSRYAVVNTTAGVFWVSQNQGKVFHNNSVTQYGKSALQEVSANGMRWWFARYLPSELLKLYPNYPLYDNIVIGVGVSMTFDNTTEVLYVSKRDFKPSSSLTYRHPDTGLPYDNNGQFWLNATTPIQLTDTRYFENASWTASYDTKIQAWISLHDWVPTFSLPSKNHFLTANSASLWKHNTTCNSYGNFYGVSYPFEVEFISATGQQVNSMRSIEYLLDTYKFHNDCRDRFHVLDENFDQAIIYNSEQVSGVLQLVLKNKTNPLSMLNYPQINPNSITINFSKEENKYRFNQFWDITKNRGEYIPVNIPMFTTAANGYIYPINPAYVNYNKPVLERKKFRHNVNRVFLRRFNSGDVKFLFKISNQKNLQSPR
jgi:hypothetical protein